MAAVVVTIGGIVLSLEGFSGMKQERFSPLNHFISELGDNRFAKHHRIFNISMFAGGILFIPFVIGIASLGTSLVFYIIVLVVGLAATIGLSLVGVFPEEKERTHTAVAGVFFFCTSLLVLFFIISLLMQQLSMFPSWVVYPSIAALAVAVIFIIDTVQLPKWEMERTYRPWDWDPDPRPTFWLNPFLEWCAVLSLMAWFFIVIVLCF